MPLLRCVKDGCLLAEECCALVEGGVLHNLRPSFTVLDSERAFDVITAIPVVMIT